MGLLAFSSTWGIVSYLRGPIWVPSAVGIAAGALSFVALAAIARRIHDWLAYFVSELLGDKEDDEVEEEVGLEYSGYEHEDSLFLVHALVSGLAREMFKQIRSTTLEVYLPDTLLIYPEPGDEEEAEGLYEGSEPDGVEAVQRGERLIIRLDSRHFARLAEAVERGEGEATVVEDEDELRALYDVAKVIAESAMDDEAFASYAAYKTLLRMIRSRRLSVPERLRDLLPFEERELRRRVREQVAEEGVSPEGSRSQPL